MKKRLLAVGLCAFSLNAFSAIENTGKALIVTGGDASELYEAMKIAKDESIPEIKIGPGVWDFGAGSHDLGIEIDNWEGTIRGQSKDATTLVANGSSIFNISGSSNVKVATLTIKAGEREHDLLPAIVTYAPENCKDRTTIFLNVDRVRLQYTPYLDENGNEQVGVLGTLVAYGSNHRPYWSRNPCDFEDLRQVSGTLTINRSESETGLATIFATAGGAKIAITDNELLNGPLAAPGAPWFNAGTAVTVVNAATELTLLRNRVTGNMDTILYASYDIYPFVSDPTNAAGKMSAGFYIKGNSGGRLLLRQKNLTTPMTMVAVDNRLTVKNPDSSYADINGGSCIGIVGSNIALTATGNTCAHPNPEYLERQTDIEIRGITTATINQPKLEVIDNETSSALIFDKSGVRAY